MLKLRTWRIPVAGMFAFALVAGCESVGDKTTAPKVPDLELSADEVVISDTSPTATLELTPSSEGQVTWQIVGAPAWLTVDPKKGTIDGGAPQSVILTGNNTGLPADTHESSLRLEYTGGVSKEFKVEFVVGPLPRMSVSTSYLSFDEFTNTGTFLIRNQGNVDFSWTATSASQRVTVSPGSGTVPFQGSTMVTLSLDRAGLGSGEYAAQIRVDSNFESTASVQLAYRHYREPFTRLAYNVIDAEYDSEHDRIVTISEGPYALHILDPETATENVIDLPSRPNCVSVRPDGQYAGVGHNGIVTTVNLGSRTLENTYSVPTDALDIVMAPNWWAYVFPRTDQWETIRCLNLASREVAMHEGVSIYAGTLARLHPSGNVIYGADNGVSPSDMEKYGIETGVAKYLYDSPYHGDFSFGGNMWFSQDGTRIYARSGNVFVSDPAQEKDMQYAGNLEGVTKARWITHSTGLGRVLVVPETEGRGAGEIRVYDPQFLIYKGKVDLAQFMVTDGAHGAFYKPEGQFVFANRSGNRVYVLFQAETAAGLDKRWAVATVDLSKIP